MRAKSQYSKGYIIAICSIIYFVSYFSRKGFAAVLVGMLNEKIIDEPLGGLIGTGMFIAYGIGQLISGYLGDRVKPKVLLIIGLAATSLCNLMMPLVENTTLFIPIWALNGLAQAMLWPPIVRMLAESLDHDAYVTGSLIVNSSAHISTVILYLYTPICLAYFSWETVFFTASILALFAIAVFALALWLVLPKEASPIKKNAAQNEAGEKESYSRLLAGAGIFYVFGAVVMMGFLRDGIESWLPTLYSQAFNKTPEESTLLSVILPMFSILSVVVIKLLHKNALFNNEIRGTAIIFGVSAGACIPLIFLVNATHPALQILALFLAALVCGCMHACNFLFIACMPGRFASRGKAATTSGYCNACVYIGAAVASYGFAVISEAFGWSITVGAWAIVASLGVLLSILALRGYSRFIKENGD